MKKKAVAYVLIVLFFLVLSYAFVPQVLGGKIVNQSDISGHLGMAQEMTVWNKAHPGEPAAWTGSMFGGMPTVTIHAPERGDWTQPLYKALLFGKRPASYFFLSLLGAFLLLLALGVHPLIAAGGAVAVSFCAYNPQIIQVGHNTKMQAIAFMPWVLAAVVFTYRSLLERKDRRGWVRGLLGAALFALALSFQVKANHPQISYYLALVLACYVLALFVSVLLSQERKAALGRFFAASGLLLVLGCAGLATNATKLMPTWEYTPYSMRGGSSSGESKGLDLGYATAWSYGWEELPNLMIPNFNGGSSSGAVNPDKSETIRLLRGAGRGDVREMARHLPLYWGPQPFTAGPMYMGAITLFLFLLGLLLCKGRDRWWLLAATILAVLLALGSHFMGFTRLCFKLLPLYNKFRTVSMALVVLQVTLPVLGFMALDRMVRGEFAERDFRRGLSIAGGITAGFCALLVLVPSLAGSFLGAADAGQPEALQQALAADRRSLLVHDALRSLLFIVAACALLRWGSARGSRRLPAALCVSLLVLVDLFTVGHRYLNAEHFVTPRSFHAQFKQRPVDKEILADKDPSFRVLDLTVNVFNDAHPSYWHKNIGGYSPAKLQRYQEYIEHHLNGEINTLYKALEGVSSLEEATAALPELEGLSKLNCRYLILGGELPPLRYPYARGNAWFEAAPEGAAIELLSYTPDCLRYRYSTPEAAKAVFSEVYYPAGWSLTVCDTGETLPIELSDEVLRSALLPAGTHELEMRFQPVSYRRGAAVSRIASVLVLIALLGAVVLFVVQKRKEDGSEG
ncbi:MAG: hypothetical protein IJV01_00145 [Bacteroidales bacterium]|nr:hypothetical protein [Bacteroidales bacterium]